MKRFSRFLPLIFIFILVLVFFYKTLIYDLVPIPADLIVGIYHPWRDHQWPGYPAGVPFKNGLISDVVSIIYPWRIYGIKLLKRGQLPLWIPHALGGQPLLANFQSAIFYPLNFLFFLFSEIDAWTIYIILGPLLASFFTYFFLRSLGLTKWSSILGGLLFAFCGFNSVWLEYGIVGHAGLWLPLILLVINRLWEKSSLPWYWLGTLGTGFSFLAGYPQISLFILTTAFFYLLAKTTGKKDLKKLLTIGSFLFLGGILSSVQLIPGVELLKNSIREGDITASAFGGGFMKLSHLLLFLFPDFYGNPSTQNFWGETPYNEVAGFIGVSGLVFALWGLFSEKRARFYKFLFGVSLLLLFRPFGPWFFSLPIPGFSSASAGRLLFLIDFSLSVLAAFGLEGFLRQKNTNRLGKILVLLSLVFLLSWVKVFLTVGRGESLVTQDWQVTKRNLILPSLSFGTVIFLIALGRLTKKKTWSAFLIILLAVFELFRFGWKYNSFSQRGWLYPETEVTNFLKERAGVDRFVGLIPQSMFIAYDFASLEGYEPLMIRRFNEFANQINEEKFSQISTGSRWVIVNRYDSPLLDLMGTRYFLSLHPNPQADWEPQVDKYPQESYELVFQHGQSQIYEKKTVFPRAFLVHDFQVLEDEKILTKLMDKKFNPAKILLLEEKPPFLPEKNLGEGAVIIDEESYFENQVSIKVKLLADGFLFLSDTYYPGWEAYIDEVPTKIYRADYSFRALFLPAGEHQVKFVYEPETFKVGSLLSIGLCLWLILGGLCFFLKRK